MSRDGEEITLAIRNISKELRVLNKRLKSLRNDKKF